MIITTTLFIMYTLLFAIIVLLLNREGAQEQYMHGNITESERKRLSKLWHSLGGWLRLLFTCLVYMIDFNLYATITAGVLLSLGYNIAINVYRWHKWWYVGKVAKTDKLIRKLFWYIDFDKAL